MTTTYPEYIVHCHRLWQDDIVTDWQDEYECTTNSYESAREEFHRLNGCSNVRHLTLTRFDGESFSPAQTILHHGVVINEPPIQGPSLLPREYDNW